VNWKLSLELHLKKVQTREGSFGKLSAPFHARKLIKSTCPNSKKAQCGFFQWAEDDEVGGGGGPEPGPSRRGGGGGRDFSGPTSGGMLPSSGLNMRLMIECFKCGKSGHWSNACPNPDGGGGRSKGRSGNISRGGGGGGGGGNDGKHIHIGGNLS